MDNLTLESLGSGDKSHRFVPQGPTYLWVLGTITKTPNLFMWLILSTFVHSMFLNAIKLKNWENCQHAEII